MPTPPLPLPETPDRVLRFWRDAGYDRWFSSDQAFDNVFRDHFLGAHMAAARGELDAWLETADGCLALLILLDQFPRNAFRGTGHMYATDPMARSVARHMRERGFDREMDHVVRDDALLGAVYDRRGAVRPEHLQAVELARPLGEDQPHACAATRQPAP